MSSSGRAPPTWAAKAFFRRHQKKVAKMLRPWSYFATSIKAAHQAADQQQIFATT